MLFPDKIKQSIIHIITKNITKKTTSHSKWKSYTINMYVVRYVDTLWQRGGGGEAIICQTTVFVKVGLRGPRFLK